MALGRRGMANYPSRTEARGADPSFCKAFMFRDHCSVYRLNRHMVRLLHMSVKYSQSSPGDVEWAIIRANLVLFDFNNIKLFFADT